MRSAIPLALAAMLGLAGGATTAHAADGERLGPRSGDVDPGRFGMRAPDAAYGAFQRGLYLTALELAMPRAEAGDRAAQTLVAEIHGRGLGVRRDEVLAAEWYGRAAEQGVVEAQFQLAMILLESDDVPRDMDRAHALMEAAADAGNPRAQFNLAQLILARDPSLWGQERAVGYFELAATAGVPDAQYALAQVHATGFGGKPADMERAREWLTRAARQGFDTAQIELATWLIEGIGGERDMRLGFAWMLQAAQTGNPAAQNRLAKLYRAGLGVEPDAVSAAFWYMLARRAGLNDALMDDYLEGLSEEELAEAASRIGLLR